MAEDSTGATVPTGYCTEGFSGNAARDDGAMWPTFFAITELTPAVEKPIVQLLTRAAEAALAKRLVGRYRSALEERTSDVVVDGLGQAEPVTAWRIIAAQTIDSKIAELIDAKSGLAARALDGAPDKDESSSVNVQLEALVGLLTDALAAESVG